MLLLPQRSPDTPLSIVPPKCAQLLMVLVSSVVLDLSAASPVVKEWDTAVSTPSIETIRRFSAILPEPIMDIHPLVGMSSAQTVPARQSVFRLDWNREPQGLRGYYEQFVRTRSIHLGQAGEGTGALRFRIAYRDDTKKH